MKRAIESVLIGSTVYAVTANLNAWPLVVITVIFTLFLLVVTDKKNQSGQSRNRDDS
jgi:hypothetical protein